MKKISLISLALFICIAAASASLAVDPTTLPNINGWKNGEIRITLLDTISGNKGSWVERDYRTSEGIPFHAVWMEGAGDKGWDISDKIISADDGPLGNGSTYRTLKIAGEKAAIEHDPVTGYSLAVKVGKLGTLTLESKIATEDEIISGGETLVNKIK